MAQQLIYVNQCAVGAEQNCSAKYGMLGQYKVKPLCMHESKLRSEGKALLSGNFGTSKEVSS
jgi:hypothetical protein